MTHVETLLNVVSEAGFDRIRAEIAPNWSAKTAVPGG
jgi:hypothetical protein